MCIWYSTTTDDQCTFAFLKKNMKALIALACRIILYRFKIWGFFPNTDEFVFVYAKKGSAEGEMTLAYWGIR